MRTIINYVTGYYRQINKIVLLLVTVLTALLIFINYQYGLDPAIRKYSYPVKLLAWTGVFAIAFILPYLFSLYIGKEIHLRSVSFLLLLLIAPMIFALKMTLNFPLQYSGDLAWNNYWGSILYWPLLFIIISALLFITWKIFDNKEQPFYGFKIKGIEWKPYWLMLLIMIPLVFAASMQPDFQAMYPKLQSVEGYHGVQLSPLHRILFEISYGSDFITIELFFRGFLVLAFIKYAGRDAILPMACFYCTIHFGKPLGECISSYFGGMILGIIVYNTRSILGGLMVHLGIAWMMELAGYFVQLRIMLNIQFSIFNIQ